MRLELVTGKLFKTKCKRCGETLWAGDDEGEPWIAKGMGAFADLDGKPFEDYYHESCLTIRERLASVNR